MSDSVVFRYCLYIVYLSVLFHSTNGSIFDYFPISKSFFGSSNENEYSNELSMQTVPYEVEVTDEKFIEQAAKFTGVSLSELDKCQHRVIFKLQSECNKLNDEDLAKLAVKLLNCQSAIEGRKIYPCSDQMQIRDCTSSMDPDTWNSYLLMSNRASAVCYSIRQAQFRGLTELAVNKLMGTAHEQLSIMSRLKQGQQRIEEATEETFERIVHGNEELQKQQNDIRRAQFYGQLALEDNIRRLANEKQLIIDGHEQLADMTRDVKLKLDEASRQLDVQTEERKDNHREILNDLIEIQKQAQAIFSRIEESSKHMLEQSALASAQYEATLAQLHQVNNTVYALVDVVTSTRNLLEDKMRWLADALGGTDDAVERLYTFTWHISFLVLAMVACAFLQVAVTSRVAVIALVPLNLLVSFQLGAQQALTPLGLTAVTASFIIAQTFLYYALCEWHKYSQHKNSLRIKQSESPREEVNNIKSDFKNKENTEEQYDSLDSSTVGNSTLNDSFTHRSRGNTYRRFNYLDSLDNISVTQDDFDYLTNPTPPLSRQGRSRSKTPLLSPVTREKCGATTRLGTPCKSLALIGRDFCHRHQTGSSVIC